jgi:hypothetical protein
MMNTTTEIPYTITADTVSVFLDGEVHTVNRTPMILEALDAATQDRDVETLRAILNPKERITLALDGSGVEIRGSKVVYHGRPVATHLENRILDIAAAGLDVEPWKRFVERIYGNPSAISRDELALFFENADLPITPDGCFLAFKRVNEDYTDCHSHKFDNSVGQVLSMPRNEVDDDRNRTCSAGFHFCSQSYLRHFLRGRGRIMVVKIDPADVVSIPSDYNNAKGRTWRYEVVGEIDTSDEDKAELWGIINDSYDSTEVGTDEYGDFEELDLEEDWSEPVVFDDNEDDDFDAPGIQSVPTFNVAPSAPRKGFWRSVFGR